MPRRSVKLPRYPMKKHFYEDNLHRLKHLRKDVHEDDHKESEENFNLFEKKIRKRTNTIA